jgi:Zn-dependent protease with chaperone function
MNFFEHQRLARRNSKIMVVLFALAVIAVVAAVEAVLGALYVWTFAEMPPASLYVAGALVTAALILGVSLFNVARLAEGGPAVARMVGARPVPPGTADPLERRLRNVVEEMAIASGVRVPEVYVMDGERGINAFAAGWDTSNAAIAVTRGTLQTLTRDELQGVVAHEFSHILNGDMRLNVRMLGLLAGIVFIGSVGEFVMRNVRGSKGDGKGAAGFVLAGLALFIIGYVGLFFARVIKAAVSRQREFLADASSVQFTRNPDGIAGALDQIRASTAGTLIANRYAEEMSHMFFCTAVMVHLERLFDTHPPLNERIRRVHPRFQHGEYRAKRVAALPLEAERFTPVERKGRRAGDLATTWGRTPEESAALVGTLEPGKVDFAARLLAALPHAVRDGLRSADGARAMMLALVLADPQEAMRSQLEAIGNPEIAAQARAMAAQVRNLGLEFHLPLIDLALVTVKTAPEAVKQEVLAALEAVVIADRRVSLHEFVVLTLVRSQLAPRPRPAETKRISDLKSQAAMLLALVAHAGTRADATGERAAGLKSALTAGAKVLGISAQLASAAALGLNTVDEALEALRALAPMEKGVLVKGLFAAVTVDGTIRVAEAGLMRLVGAVLDCPLPPLLDRVLPEPL